MEDEGEEVTVVAHPDTENLLAVDAGSQPRELKKQLTLLNGVGFIVGTMIGSGIFSSPGSVLSESGAPGASLLAWSLAGLLALMGAASYAELGTAIPHSGGEYTYIMRAFGPLPAFLFTWASALVTRPGSLAIITLVCGEYIVRPFYPADALPSEWVVKGTAIAITWLLCIVNFLSVKWATRLQDVTTLLKVFALAAVTVIGIVFLARNARTPGTPAYDNFHTTFASPDLTAGKFGLAVVAGLWSYDGWNNLNMITGELKNVNRDLPRSLFIGMPLVAIAYIMANVAYFAVLPITSIVDFANGKTNDAFATDFGRETMKTAGLIILPICIAASTFGAANGSAFTGARLVYVSAKEGHLPAFLGGLWNKKDPTPGPALIFQGLLATLMLLPGNFNTLVEYFSAAAWVFYGLAIASLLKLRWTEPALPRPYRVWTWVPVVFFAVSVCLVLSLTILNPVQTSIAFGFILSGIPVFYCKPYLQRLVARSKVTATYKHSKEGGIN